MIKGLLGHFLGALEGLIPADGTVPQPPGTHLLWLSYPAHLPQGLPPGLLLISGGRVAWPRPLAAGLAELGRSHWELAVPALPAVASTRGLAQ